MPSPSDERGFLLFWLMVIIAVMMLSVTVITANDVNVRERNRIDAAQSALLEFDSATVRFYNTSVKKYPSRLWHLALQPRNNDPDICGANYGGSNPNDTITGWVGPYVTRVIEKDAGTRIGIGIANDTLRRFETRQVRDKGKTTIYYGVQIRVLSVRDEDALKLDARFDTLQVSAPRRDTTGIVRWDQPTGNSSLTTIRYYTAVPEYTC